MTIRSMPESRLAVNQRITRGIEKMHFITHKTGGIIRISFLVYYFCVVLIPIQKFHTFYDEDTI
jgi:predicted transcriptional regulator